MAIRHDLIEKAFDSQVLASLAGVWGMNSTIISVHPGAELPERKML